MTKLSYLQKCFIDEMKRGDQKRATMIRKRLTTKQHEEALDVWVFGDVKQ